MLQYNSAPPVGATTNYLRCIQHLLLSEQHSFLCHKFLNKRKKFLKLRVGLMFEKSGDEFMTHQCKFSCVDVFYLNPLVYTTK